MEFLWDNAVAASAILLGVLVVAALVILGLSGLRLWRRIKAANARIGAASAALMAETDRLQAALDALPARQTELQGSIAGLQQRLGLLGLLASAASEASAVLRSPLRYIGR
ncbi:MAG: hypothetical protein AB7V42_05100 [Thermoleophilia bacterium]